MVAKFFGDPVALGAMGIGVTHREAEPKANHDLEDGPEDVQPQSLRRWGGEPRTRTRLLQELEVGSVSFLPRSGGGQLGNGYLVKHLGQLLLPVRGRRWHKELVLGRESLVHLAKSFFSRLLVVMAIDAGTKVSGGENRSSVSSRAMEVSVAEAQATAAGGQRGLEPRLFSEGACAGGFQALSHCSIEGQEGGSHQGCGGKPFDVCYFAERSTVAQEQQAGLRVRQLADGMEEGLGCFGLGGGDGVVAELLVADGRAQKGE